MKKIIIEKLIQKIKRNINKRAGLLKEINNFERNINPFLCPKCQVKLRRVKGQNILKIVSKQQYFCKECNDIIATKSSEIFSMI